MCCNCGQSNCIVHISITNMCTDHVVHMLCMIITINCCIRKFVDIVNHSTGIHNHSEYANSYDAKYVIMLQVCDTCMYNYCNQYFILYTMLLLLVLLITLVLLLLLQLIDDPPPTNATATCYYYKYNDSYSNIILFYLCNQYYYELPSMQLPLRRSQAQFTQLQPPKMLIIIFVVQLVLLTFM
jgi:hypothetical protein